MTGTQDAGPNAEKAPEELAAELPVRPMVIIGMLVVSAFVMILNETILSVALQHLTGDLGVSATTVQWLTSGFLLTMGVVIPTTGFVLQRFTPRQVFLAAMGLFSLGTLICALSPGFTMLLVGRVVQASGTAVMIPLLMTTVMTLIPAERRGSVMGSITIVIAVAPAVGPTAGGLILDNLSWPWMFWSVLPLAVAAFVLGLLFFRLRGETRSTPLDLLSVLVSAIAFSGIVYGFATIGEGAGASVPPWIPLVVGALALTLFVARQLRLQRGDRALLDLRPFTFGRFRVAVALSALLFMTLFGAGAILLPIYLQGVLGVDPQTTGLAVLPGGLILGLMGRPIGWLYDRVGARPLIIPGAIGLAVSMWLFAFLGASAPLWAVIVVHIILMAALGLMMTPLLTDGLGDLPPNLYSHGSAIMTTLQQVAGAASTAGLVTIAAVFSTSVTAAPDAAGLRAGFMAAGILGILAVVISLFVRTKAAGPVGDQPTPGDGDPSAEDGAGGSPSRRLRGRVSTGVDAREVVVTLVDTDGGQRGHARAVDGRYELELPSPGTWYVVLSGPGLRPHVDRLVVDGADVVHDVELAAAGSGAPRAVVHPDGVADDVRETIRRSTPAVP